MNPEPLDATRPPDPTCSDPDGLNATGRPPPLWPNTVIVNPGPRASTPVPRPFGATTSPGTGWPSTIRLDPPGASEDPTGSGTGTNTDEVALADGVGVGVSVGEGTPPPPLPPPPGTGAGGTGGLDDAPDASCRDPIVQALAPTPRFGRGAPTWSAVIKGDGVGDIVG